MLIACVASFAFTTRGGVANAGEPTPTSTPVAGAATSSDPNALELFEQGARAYREGRFPEAVEKLQAARALKREPVLLYNLARAYEALGKSADAAEAYDGYLAEEPNAPDRKAIEGRIATLRAQAAQQAELAAARERPREDTSDAFGPVPWILGGLGIAALGTGVALGVVATGKHDDAVAEPVQRTAADLQSDAESLSQAATVTVLAGAVVTTIAATWLGMRLFRSGGSSPAGARPTNSPLLLGGRF